MIRRLLAVLLPLYLLMSGCATPPPQIPAYMFAMPSHQVDYLEDVQPILVKRCVVCHSCYNSPCQLKLSSWDGLDRGASKEKIYNAARLKTMDPSRLFIDAQTTGQWRDKGFYSVTETPENQYDQSILYTFLEHKRVSPEVSGSYFPEADDLTCAQNSKELGKYLKNTQTGECRSASRLLNRRNSTS